MGPFPNCIGAQIFPKIFISQKKVKVTFSLCISSIARSTWQSPRGPWQECPPHHLPASKATCSPPPSSPPPQGLWDQGCPDPPSPGSPPISQLCRSLSEIFSSRNAPRNGSASWAAGEHGRSPEHCGLMLVCPCRGSRSAGLSPRGPFGPVLKITSYVRVRVCRSIFEIYLVLQGMSIGTQVKAGWAEIALALLVLAAVPVLGDWTLLLGVEDPFHGIVQMGFLEDSPQLGIALRTWNQEWTKSQNFRSKKK